MARSILTRDDEITRDAGVVYICSGYLVEQGRVLLVHHNRFGKWVPPGGHIEPGETFAQTAAREFKEETGLLVRVLSSQPAMTRRRTPVRTASWGTQNTRHIAVSRLTATCGNTTIK